MSPIRKLNDYESVGNPIPFEDFSWPAPYQISAAISLDARIDLTNVVLIATRVCHFDVYHDICGHTVLL